MLQNIYYIFSYYVFWLLLYAQHQGTSLVCESLLGNTPVSDSDSDFQYFKSDNVKVK